MTMGMGLNLGHVYGGGYANGYTGSYGTNGTTGSVYQLNYQGDYCASAEDGDYEDILYYLNSGDVDLALQMYKEIEAQYGESSATKGFKVASGGKSMNQAIQASCSGSFSTGLAKGLPIIGIFTESTSEAEAVADLNGREVKDKEKFKEGAGGVISALGTSAAIGVGTAALLGAIGTTATGVLHTVCAAAGPIGWGVGIVLGVAGIIQTFAKK